jgi:hypothetical protein
VLGQVFTKFRDVGLSDVKLETKDQI